MLTHIHEVPAMKVTTSIIRTIQFILPAYKVMLLVIEKMYLELNIRSIEAHTIILLSMNVLK